MIIQQSVALPLLLPHENQSLATHETVASDVIAYVETAEIVLCVPL